MPGFDPTAEVVPLMDASRKRTYEADSKFFSRDPRMIATAGTALRLGHGGALATLGARRKLHAERRPLAEG